MTVAASSKIELAGCFEDVAKNIFKSPPTELPERVRACALRRNRTTETDPALFVSRADSTRVPAPFAFHRNRPELAAVFAADTGLGLAER